MSNFIGINISMQDDYRINSVSMKSAINMGNCHAEKMPLKSVDFTMTVMMKI